MDAKRAWVLSGLSRLHRRATLLIFNPHSSPTQVWIRFAGSGVDSLKEVTAGGGDLQTVELEPAEMAGHVYLRADLSIVPLVVTSRSRSVTYQRGMPTAGQRGKSSVMLPARAWRFPAVRRRTAVVLLSIYNPNTAPVEIAIRVRGSQAGTYRVRVRGSSSIEISLSQLAGSRAFGALTVSATDDVVPQRYVIGGQTSTTAQGFPS